MIMEQQQNNPPAYAPGTEPTQPGYVQPPQHIQPGYAQPPQTHPGYAPAPQPGYGSPLPQQGYYPPQQQQTTNTVVVAQQAAPATNTVIIQKTKPGVNHCLHCCITIFFLPWIIVWIILCICNGC